MANPKGNPQNMKPLNTRTKEEQKKIATMGGKASGVVRRQKSTVQKLLNQWAASPLTAEWKDIARNYGIDTDEGRALVAASIIKGALDGNSKYLDRLLAMIGEDNPAADMPDDGFTEAIKGTAANDWGDTDV